MTNITDAPEGGKGGVTYSYSDGCIWRNWLGLSSFMTTVDAEAHLKYGRLTDEQRRQLTDAHAQDLAHMKVVNPLVFA